MKVAVIGSGAAGLGSTWLLNEYSGHEVHLFEADDRAGGHANTVPFTRPDKPGATPVDVDRGFIVFNIPTYPNFARFLHLVGISWLATEMTFSVSRDRGAFEWAGKNPLTIFCQPSNLLKLSMWRMGWDIIRFNVQATAAVTIKPGSPEDTIGDLSLGQYLEKEGYSRNFVDDYILPMTACIWSTPPTICALDFPARAQFRFMYNHHLLQVLSKPPWLTIKGGSNRYVQRIVSKLPQDQLHLSTPIRAVVPSNSKVTIRTQAGEDYEFDHVVMACHSDTSARLLGVHITELEKKILGGVRWSKNEVVMHNDIELMPVRTSAWSCWNFLTSSKYDESGNLNPNGDNVSLTYDMNQLQHISEEDHGKVLVTLNPPYGPKPETIINRQNFSHPMFTLDTPWAQANLPSIQNVRGISFAGAWTKYGFHEDAFTSGMLVATKYLGAKCPFLIKSPDRNPTFHYGDSYVRIWDHLEAIRLWLEIVILGPLFSLIFAASNSKKHV